MTDGITDDLMSLMGESDTSSQAASPDAGPLLSRTGVDMSRMLTFDFETGPDTERLDQFNLPGLVRTPLEECPTVEDFMRENSTVAAVEKSLKELLPCAEWLVVAREAEEAEKNRKGVLSAIGDLMEAEVNQLKTLCTTPRYAKITAFGWAVGNDEVRGKVVSHIEQPMMDDDEAGVLRLFWDLVEECHPLIGFNVKAFDIPLALTRSAILGVEPSRRIKLNKYNNSEVIDLFTDQGLMKGRCKEVCEDLGIEVPAGQMEGSRAWTAYCINPDSLRTYVKSDVEIERKLFWWGSGYFWD